MRAACRSIKKRIEAQRMKGMARVSIPILPEVLLQTYHNKKNKSSEGRIGLADASHGKGKEKTRVPLAQRLDRLRNEKTNDFIAEITRCRRVAAPIIPSRSSRRPSYSTSQPDRFGQSHRRLVAANEVTSPKAGGNDVKPIAPVPPSSRQPSNANPSRRRGSVMASRGNTRKLDAPETVDEKVNAEEECKKGNINASNDNFSTSTSPRTASAGNVGIDSSVDIETVEDSSLRAPIRRNRQIAVPPSGLGSPSIKKTIPKSEKSKAAPIQYCNVKIVDPSLPTPGLIGQENPEISEESAAVMKRYQKIFDDARAKMESLESNYASKMHDIEKSGDEMLDGWEGFQEAKAMNDSHMLYLMEHKEFLFPQEMVYYLKSFEANGISCQSDLRRMRVLARKRLHMRSMMNIAKHKWLLEAIGKLKEYQKKTKQIVPRACFRLLIVLKNLIMLGVELNSEVYYHVMEACIQNPSEEHQIVLVYKTLKYFRDYVKIPPEEFLSYLEERDYHPCPELLANIRSIKFKQARDSMLANQKKKKMAALVLRNVINSSSRPTTREDTADSSISRGRHRFDSSVSFNDDDFIMGDAVGLEEGLEAEDREH